MLERNKRAAVLFSLIAILAAVIVLVLSLPPSLRRADVPVVAPSDHSRQGVTEHAAIAVDLPFFVTSTDKSFDSLTIEDLPGLEFNYGGDAVFAHVQTPNALYVSNGERILKYEATGTLLGISDASVVSSTRRMIRYRDSLFILGDRRLVEMDLATERVVHIYPFSFGVPNTDMAASERYLWITYMSDIIRIDPSTQEVRMKKYTKSDIDPATLPSSLGISVLENDEVLLSPGDNTNYKWGNLRLNASMEEEYLAYERSVPGEPSSRLIETIYEDGGGWRAIVADIRIGQGASSTVIPAQLRDYYEMIRFDKDRYYVASSAGIESLDRGQLLPTVRASVKSDGFPMQGSALILSDDRRFVAYFGTIDDELGGSGISEASLLVYDTVTGKKQIVPMGKKMLGALTDSRYYPRNAESLELKVDDRLLTLAYGGKVLVTFIGPK